MARWCCGTRWRRHHTTRQIGDWLRRWAAEAPDRVALAEWDQAGTLHTTSYVQVRTTCDRLSQGLLDRGLGLDRPVALLSEKSVAHALLTLAALQVGIPICPISPAYSLRPEARGRLAFCLGAIRPGLVLVDDRDAYAAALDMLPPGTEVVTEAELAGLGRDLPGWRPLSRRSIRMRRPNSYSPPAPRATRSRWSTRTG